MEVDVEEANIRRVKALWWDVHIASVIHASPTCLTIKKLILGKCYILAYLYYLHFVKRLFSSYLIIHQKFSLPGVWSHSNNCTSLNNVIKHIKWAVTD